MSDKNNEWEELLIKVSKRFNILADFDFLLFTIGIQEHGKGFQKYEKQEKMDMINLARCVLFEQCGYYKQNGTDEEGWPTFEVLKPVDKLLPSEREAMLKQAMITYLNDKL